MNNKINFLKTIVTIIEVSFINENPKICQIFVNNLSYGNT